MTREDGVEGPDGRGGESEEVGEVICFEIGDELVGCPVGGLEGCERDAYYCEYDAWYKEESRFVVEEDDACEES